MANQPSAEKMNNKNIGNFIVTLNHNPNLTLNLFFE